MATAVNYRRLVKTSFIVIWHQYSRRATRSMPAGEGCTVFSPWDQ